MQAVLQALLALQEIDRDIFRAQGELKRLPAERAGRKAEIEKRLARLADVRARAAGLRVKIKEIDDLTTTQRQRVRKVENEAAGSRNDMALLAAFQHQIKTLKREISSSEEEGLRLLEEVETLETSAKTLGQETADAQKVFDEFSANVDREVAAAKAKLAELDGRICQACYMEIPVNLVVRVQRGSELVQCPSCDRILFLPSG